MGIPFIFTIGIFLCLIFYAATDVRGDDQYWYMGDVETLLLGGEKVTNTIFPVQIMEPGPLQCNTFIHNIPNLYFVLPAAKLFGAFKGWIVTNIVATIITAVLIMYLVYKASDLLTAFFAFATYLLLPLNIWLVSQPLAEATMTPFVAIGVLLYVFAGNKKLLWILLMGDVCIIYYCRASFIPLLFIIPVVFLYQNRPIRNKTILFSILLLLFAAFFVLFKSRFFEQNIDAGWREYINISVPDLTDSMHLYFCIPTMSMHPTHILSKIAMNLEQQFFPENWAFQIFYFPFNILSGFTIFLYLKVKSVFVRNISICGIVLIVLHFITILMIQNHARYLLITTPAIWISGVIGLNTLNIFQNLRSKQIILFGTILLLIFLNIPLVIRSHKKGLEEKKIRSEIKALFDETIPQHDSVIISYEHRNLLLAYTLRPRNVIFLKPIYNLEDYILMKEKGKAKWLICAPASTLIEDYRIYSPSPVLSLPSPYDKYTLFKF